jgi:predicted dehydrogenase
MIKKDILQIACIGCGARGQMYTELVSEMKDKFIVVAAADPVKERIDKVNEFSGNKDFKPFNSAEELLNQPKLADIIIISTQDESHFRNCKKAIELGYNILLEKPIATQIEEIFELEKLALKHNSRVMICYVLRFSPFYQKIKEIIDEGILGDLVSLNYVSGISPWRMAHSFVRGHWADSSRSTPTIVAKACHDADIIYWLAGKRCKSLSSFGSLRHFNSDSAPRNAPERCTEECPDEKDCIYSAMRYISDMRYQWLPQIYDNADTAEREDIIEWLKISPWGRCVYHCDNNALDHQVISIEFEDKLTGTFTMTAFESGRHIEIYGTQGILKGGETLRKQFNSEIIIFRNNKAAQIFNVTEDLNPVDLRRERDKRLINTLYSEMTKPDHIPLDTSIAASVHSHIIAFAAEEARLTHSVVDIEEFEAKFNNK